MKTCFAFSLLAQAAAVKPQHHTVSLASELQHTSTKSVVKPTALIDVDHSGQHVSPKLPSLLTLLKHLKHKIARGPSCAKFAYRKITANIDCASLCDKSVSASLLSECTYQATEVDVCQETDYNHATRQYEKVDAGEDGANCALGEAAMKCKICVRLMNEEGARYVYDGLTLWRFLPFNSESYAAVNALAYVILLALAGAVAYAGYLKYTGAL